jgi:hypothetical protein
MYLFKKKSCENSHSDRGRYLDVNDHSAGIMLEKI